MSGQIVAFRSLLMRFLSDDSGQDLVEYALIVALIAFAAMAGMNSVASSINSAFTGIGTTLSGAI